MVRGVAAVLKILGVDSIGSSVSMELVTNEMSWPRSASGLSSIAASVAAVTVAVSPRYSTYKLIGS